MLIHLSTFGNKGLSNFIKGILGVPAIVFLLLKVLPEDLIFYIVYSFDYCVTAFFYLSAIKGINKSISKFSNSFIVIFSGILTLIISYVILMVLDL